MPRAASPADSANPLLLEWVKEWWDTARERNSKGVRTYKHAYEALKACPIVFEHPSELITLKGFGPKLCDRLTDQLRRYCDENGLSMPEHPGLKKYKDRADGETDDAAAEGAARSKKPRKAKLYVPAMRSGAYAIVKGLSTLDENAPMGMTKVELIDVAQPHCDSSFTAPSDPTKFYTAWNSIKTLLQKELVYERGRPLKRYALTDEGWVVAKSLNKTTASGMAGARSEAGVAPRSVAVDDDELDEVETQPHVNLIADDDTAESSTSLPRFTPIVLHPGNFSVRMILDTREVRSKTDRDYMQEELAKKDVMPITRSLELGDVLWVAKCHDADFLARHGAEGDEIVLDWILERKRLDDLIGSIKDGRFREQKFRLKRSGIKNVIYLIEEISMDAQHYGKYEESVQSAIASTQVVNGYFVKKTQKMDDTVRYLARMTGMLQKMYESKPLKVIPTKVITSQNYLPLLEDLQQRDPDSTHHITYPALASLVSKSELLTLGDLYLKMLMCTRGITGERAIEIAKKWRTPIELVKAFDEFGSDEASKKRKRELISTYLNGPVARKKVGKALSQKVAEVWGDV